MKLLNAALVGTAVALLALPASAQQRTNSNTSSHLGSAADSWGSFAGGSIGDSDYDTGFKFFFGQQFHPNLAWEGQIVSFGERDNHPGKSSAWTAGGSLLGILPLNNDFSLFAKAGLHYVKTKETRAGFSASDSGVDVGVGVGARYRINQQFSARLEFENIGDAEDIVSVGLQLRF